MCSPDLPSTSMLSPLLFLQDTYFTSPNPQNPPAAQTQPPAVAQTSPPNSARLRITPRLDQQATLPSDELAAVVAQRCHEAIYNLIRVLPEHVQSQDIAGSAKYVSDGIEVVREVQQGLKLLTQRLQATERNASRQRAQPSETVQQLFRENAILRQQFLEAGIYHNTKVQALEKRIKHLESSNATYLQAMHAMEELDRDDEEVITLSAQDAMQAGMHLVDRAGPARTIGPMGTMGPVGTIGTGTMAALYPVEEDYKGRIQKSCSSWMSS